MLPELVQLFQKHAAAQLLEIYRKWYSGPPPAWAKVRSSGYRSDSGTDVQYLVSVDYYAEDRKRIPKPDMTWSEEGAYEDDLACLGLRYTRGSTEYLYVLPAGWYPLKEEM